MRMANVLALKEEGTSPPIEGMLAKFAEIHGIRSTKDAASLAKRHFDILLIDTSMPRIEAQDLVQALQSTGSTSRSVILLIDFNERPSQLRRRLDQLAKLNLTAVTKPPDLRTTLRLLDISQESLARMLNVSSRTAHRWLGKTRPRNNPQLRQLQHVVELLLDTLNSEPAIHEYLNHPNPSLGGEAPIAVLSRGEFDRVEADLQAVREGVYV
jgi:response regulator RpfG family c-di-GMP phosphodiesterase